MTIRAGFQTFDFQQKFELPKLLSFATEKDALKWLKRLWSEQPHLIFRFREYLARYTCDAESSRLTDDQAIERLAVLLYVRKIVVITRETRAGGGGATARTEVLAPAFPLSERRSRMLVTASRKTKTWIAIELKDSDGNPVAGEDYKLELPNGRVLQGKLDGHGTAKVSDLDPGQCRVTFPRLDGSTWALAQQTAD